MGRPAFPSHISSLRPSLFQSPDRQQQERAVWVAQLIRLTSALCGPARARALTGCARWASAASLCYMPLGSVAWCGSTPCKAE